MKQFYTLAACAAFAISGFAQSKAPQLPVEKRIAHPKPTYQMTGLEDPGAYHSPSVRPTETTTYTTRDVTIEQNLIGFTEYDLQSNASIDNRMILKDGEVRAAWTMSLEAGFGDRGTGFNEYIDGWDVEPYERIESVRTGWPSLVETADGRVMAISHSSIDSPLHIAYRDAGASSWSETELNIGDTPGHLWPRVAVGGADGNTVHVICVSTPEANEGAIYQDQDGALLYFRSTDGGDTWDIENQIFPELNSENFLGFDGDTYQIDASGTTVAFAVFNDLGDSFTMISNDNGDTWEYHSLVDFPVDLYVVDSGLPDDQGEDFNEDGIFQEYFNCDGAGDVLIGNDGTVHVFFGNMYYMDDVLDDDQFSYFPGTNGLSYWNDTMDDNMREEIAFAYDVDGNGTWDIDDFPLYFVSASGMPSAATDAEGNLYVSYSAIMESHSTGVQNYRHIHIVRSEDGGLTWNSETACNITPDADFDFFESVFGSLAKQADDNLHLVYQRDFEPGLAVRGDEDPVDINDMVYLRIPLEDLPNCDEGEEIVYTSIDEPFNADALNVYPNPTDAELNIVLDNRQQTIVQLFDLTGKEVLNETVNRNFSTFDVSALPSGVYVLQLTRGEHTHQERVTIQ
jgi:hypothetical protein